MYTGINSCFLINVFTALKGSQVLFLLPILCLDVGLVFDSAISYWFLQMDFALASDKLLFFISVALDENMWRHIDEGCEPYLTHQGNDVIYTSHVSSQENESV